VYRNAAQLRMQLVCWAIPGCEGDTAIDHLRRLICDLIGQSIRYSSVSLQCLGITSGPQGRCT